MLKKFFSLFQKKGVPASVNTAPLSPEWLTADQELNNEVFNIISFTAQSIGKVRTTNEDSVYATTITAVGNHHQINFGLFMIADGMGGHVNGEITSSVAINTISSTILEKLKPILQNSGSQTSNNESLHELVQNAIHLAQETLLRVAPGAGTTLTMALVLNNQLTIAQIGDSRCYSYNNTGQLKLLTQDHSLVTRLVEIGHVSLEEAANHPQKHILYKALGQKGILEADIETVHISKNSLLVLCSDGLWGQVSDDAMASILSNTSTLSESANKMVALANSLGGPDNISLILVKFI